MDEETLHLINELMVTYSNLSLENPPDISQPVPFPKDPVVQPQPHMFCEKYHDEGVAFYCRCDTPETHKFHRMIVDGERIKRANEVLDIVGLEYVDMVVGNQIRSLMLAETGELRMGNRALECDAM